MNRTMRFVLLGVVLLLTSVLRCFAPPPLVTGDVPTAARETFECFLGVRYQDAGRVARQLPFAELVYGFTDRTEIVVELPLISRAGEFGLGDAVIGVKTVLLPETVRRAGVAFSYEANLPLGDEELGLGDGNWQHELRLRAQKTSGWFTPIANLGYTFVGEPEISGVRQPRRDAWRASIAQEWQVGPGTKLLSELYYRGSDEPGGAHVLAANVGFKHRLHDDLSIHAAIGKSLREGSRGGPNLRIYAGVKWEFAVPWRKRKKPS
jgi:hypothetical protein